MIPPVLHTDGCAVCDHHDTGIGRKKKTRPRLWLVLKIKLLGSVSLQIGGHQEQMMVLRPMWRPLIMTSHQINRDPAIIIGNLEIGNRVGMGLSPRRLADESA